MYSYYHFKTKKQNRKQAEKQQLKAQVGTVSTKLSDLVQSQLTYSIKQSNDGLNFDIHLRNQIQHKSHLNWMMPDVDSSKLEKVTQYFEFIEMLGQGAFGQVHLARKIKGKDHGKLFALKCVKKQSGHKDKLFMESALVEINVLSMLRDHSMLVKMHYAFQTSEMLFIALDYCPGGELFFYLQQVGKFREEVAQFYAANILEALCALHQNGVLYRDLKPENIMVKSNGYLKLTDFGLSLIVSQDLINQSDQIIGTPEYMAPEVLQGKAYDIRSEWWAFGCLIYEILIGQPPFTLQENTVNSHSINMSLLSLIKKNSPKLDYQFISEDAIDLLNKLLCQNPANRLGSLSVNEIKQHKWFQNIDWKQIRNQTAGPPYVPHLQFENDTRYFSKEMTQFVYPMSVDSESQDSDAIGQIEDGLIQWLYPLNDNTLPNR